MWYTKLLRPAALTGVLLVALAGCSGDPVDLDNPPLGADGQSRWLFVQNTRQGMFIGALYARKAGSGSWGNDLVLFDNIYPGDSRAFSLDDGSGNCKFDLRRLVYAVDEPPGYQDQMNVDLCAMNKKRQVWLL